MSKYLSSKKINKILKEEKKHKKLLRNKKFRERMRSIEKKAKKARKWADKHGTPRVKALDHEMWR